MNECPEEMPRSKLTQIRCSVLCEGSMLTREEWAVGFGGIFMGWKRGEVCRKLWMYGNVLLGSGKMSRGFFHWRKVLRVEKLHVQTHEYLKEHSTVSSLHAHLQVANFQRCELVFVCNVQLHTLVHVSGVRCHVRASSASGCVCVCFAAPCWIECCSSVSLFQAHDV